MKKTVFNFLIFILIAAIQLPVNTYAYKLQCENIFDLSQNLNEKTSITSFEEPKSLGLVLTKAKADQAIHEYKKLMNLRQISHKKQDLSFIKSQLQRITGNQKQQLLDILSASYNDVKTLKYERVQGKPIYKSFKRHLDLAVSELLSPYYPFKKSLEKFNDHDRDQLETQLNLYYKQVQKITRSPVLNEASDVLHTSLRLQEFAFSDLLKTWDEEKIAKQTPLILYGSFVNGKAYLKNSDLDFAVLDSKMEVQMNEKNLHEILPEFPLTEAQAHVISPSQIHELGFMNPIVILIYPRYIIVRAYKSQNHYLMKNKPIFVDHYF